MGDGDHLEKRIQSLDDKTLIRLVAVEAAQFRPEAVLLALSEIRRRGLSTPNAEEYLALYPAERIGSDGFCAGCSDQTDGPTVAVSRQNLASTLFGMGPRLHGSRERCPVCRSSLRTLWFCFGFIPLVPLGTYRVIAGELGIFEDRCVGRRVRRQSSPPNLPAPIGGAPGGTQA